MVILIRIPALWRPATDGVAEVVVAPGPLADALAALTERYPRLRPKLFDPHGHLHTHTQLFINQEHIRYLDGLATPLHDGDELYIVPMLAGG